MNKHLLRAAATLLAGTLLAAESTPKDDVIAAAKKLAEKPNYSWRTTVAVPENAQFRPGPTEGQTEKDGFTRLTMSFGERKVQAVLKGDKAAMTGRDEAWQSLADLDNSEGPGRFMGRFLRNFKAPVAQATDLAKGTKDLKLSEGGVCVGDLTEEAAKAEFRFGNVNNPKGSVKFWLKDGVLAKYEFKTQGKVEFNGNEMDVDRTTTVEIKDVGTTKVELPDDAKKKL
jgi:hypothetical protein